MARGATWWWSSCQAAPTPRRHPKSPATQKKRNFAGLRLLYVQESHAREPKPPLSGIGRRKLDLKLPSGAIPNFGADHEIKSQPRFVHAILTCWLGSQSPCRSRVAGRRAHRITPFLHTELLAFDEPEGAIKTCERKNVTNFVQRTYGPDTWHSSRPNREGVIERRGPFSLHIWETWELRSPEKAGG
jgi:hypothetical protein